MRVANIFSWVTAKATTSATRRLRVIPSIENLEARDVPALNPSPLEQEMLEYTNRMRMDPAGELNRLLVSTNPLQARDSQVQAALSYFGVSGSTLVSQWASLSPAAPLAWHEGLMNSARTHNLAMIAADTQSHQLPGEASLGARATAGGYTNWSGVGENIYAFSNSVLYGHAGFAIDWGSGPGGIQSPAGHRINMMNSSYREIGISVIAENNGSTQVGPQVITQDFGNRFSFGNPYLLGVVFSDSNSNNFYNAGEGLGGINVNISGAAGNFNTTTMSAGGYQLQVPSGSYTVTFSGGSLSSPIVKTVTVGSSNVKVDGKAGDTSNPPPNTNTAPILNASYNATLSSIIRGTTNPAGNTVSSIVGNSITDVNTSNSLGIAVTAGNSTSGQWQYSLDNGSTWNSLSTASSSAARLLRMSDRVRFVPNSTFTGTDSFTYRAWDQTTGTPGGTANVSTSSQVGGSTAFSTATDSASINVITSTNNTAPVLNTTGSFVLPYVARNSTTPTPIRISTLLGTNVSDSDAGAVEGIAITAIDTTKGAWQYSLNNGTNWYTLSTASNTGALLLREGDLLRFKPKTNMVGQSSMVFRAWDQTFGTAGSLVNASTGGGNTAFSTDQVFAQVQVGNSAPVLNTSSPFVLNPYTQGTSNPGTLISTLLGNAVSDTDMNAKKGIAVVGLTGTATGKWQYSLDNGTTWVNFPATTGTNARLLRASDKIRYVPNAGFTGQVTLKFLAWDQSTGVAGSIAKLSSTTVGGFSAYSKLSGIASLVVS